MTHTARKPGDFCWINMVTTEPDKARDFFAKVLGWTYAEIPGMGHKIVVGGHDVGGLFDVVSPRTPNGGPSYIGVMIKTADAAATCAFGNSLGGQFSDPWPIGANMKMALGGDCNGGRFDLFEPVTAQGTDCDSRAHGAPSWFETLTTDVAKAREFYTKLFGWTAKVSQVAGGDYTEFSLDGVPIAGMMALTPEMGTDKPHWGVYFTVTNVDETVALVKSLGGDVCVPAMDIPGVGRFCGATSPQGVVFYAITYTG